MHSKLYPVVIVGLSIDNLNYFIYARARILIIVHPVFSFFRSCIHHLIIQKLLN
jgi:hypothetical protein